MKINAFPAGFVCLLGTTTVITSTGAGAASHATPSIKSKEASEFPIFGPPGTKTPTMFSQFEPYLPTTTSGSIADDAVLYFPHISQTYGGGDWDWASGSKLRTRNNVHGKQDRSANEENESSQAALVLSTYTVA